MGGDYGVVLPGKGWRWVCSQVVVRFGGIWGVPQHHMYGWQGPLQVLWGRIIRVIIPLLVDWGWQGTVVPFNLVTVRDYSALTKYCKMPWQYVRSDQVLIGQYFNWSDMLTAVASPSVFKKLDIHTCRCNINIMIRYQTGFGTLSCRDKTEFPVMFLVMQSPR